MRHLSISRVNLGLLEIRSGFITWPRLVYTAPKNNDTHMWYLIICVVDHQIECTVQLCWHTHSWHTCTWYYHGTKVSLYVGVRRWASSLHIPDFAPYWRDELLLKKAWIFQLKGELQHFQCLQTMLSPSFLYQSTCKIVHISIIGPQWITFLLLPLFNGMFISL